MIIPSLLDTDLYKFTMMQAVLHQFPGAQVEYRFKCRNAGAPGVEPLAPYVAQIREEIRALCALKFGEAELAYLRSMRFIKSDFVDFLGLFSLNEKYIDVQRFRFWPSLTRCISGTPSRYPIFQRGGDVLRKRSVSFSSRDCRPCALPITAPVVGFLDPGMRKY
jgi:hypothetical protein